MEQEFQTLVADINPRAIFADVKTRLSQAIAAQKYEEILRYYDNKGLLTEAAKKLGYTRKSLEEFIGRALRSDESSQLKIALATYLPPVKQHP